MSSGSDIPPPAIVAGHVSRFMGNDGCGRWMVRRILKRSWSTLYFLRPESPAGRSGIVAKITRTPDQTHFEQSWQSEQLLLRGRREYACLSQVHEHFQSAAAELAAVHPLGYIEEINALLTDEVNGRSAWLEALRLRQLLRQPIAAISRNTMHEAGSWLRWLHCMPRTESAAGRRSAGVDTLRTLVEQAGQLKVWGIHLQAWSGWKPALERLRRISSDCPTWLHGDFHPGNLWLLKDGRLTCFDTALERYGSPYEDLGKFTAGLKSRRVRVMSGSRLPPQSSIDELESALLVGYHQDRPVDTLALRLYEGRYLLQKWLEMLAALSNRASLQGARILAPRMVHPAFKRMLRVWLASINQPIPELGARVTRSSNA